MDYDYKHWKSIITCTKCGKELPDNYKTIPSEEVKSKVYDFKDPVCDKCYKKYKKNKEA
jgi:hypothetical protein